jgi:outer membrane protein TolC
VLSSRLKSDNPELQLLEALVKAEEQGIKLARKDFYPDFSLGIDYVGIGDREQAGDESGDDAVVAKLSLTLPLYQHKYRAGVEEARRIKISTQKMLENKLYALESELAQALFDLKDSKRRVRLFRDTLVPKGEESLETTYTAFEAEKASFLDLLDTERDLLDFRLSLARAFADIHIAASKLGSILGEYSELETPDKLGE